MEKLNNFNLYIMIYVIITTCLKNDINYELRKEQYLLCIPNIINNFLNIPNVKIIIKMTGRYYFSPNSNFINTLKNCNLNKTDTIIRYGSYQNKNYNKNDCVTGLIGLKCKYILQITILNDTDCIEWRYAAVTHNIIPSNIIELNELGIYICPSSFDYFYI
jgi:predicted nucleic-acid-binding protein